MEYEFYKAFLRDIKKIKDKNLKKYIADTVIDVSKAETINDISNCKKMKGHKTAYRIKTGNYRIGFYLSKNVVEFASFEHRKDIYKKFP
ncbi:MAG: plasmid stabilization protein [Flavobacteriales bacterium]|nr:plasmid stabilization protein [Flavobacteriales bacterium]